MIYCDVIIPLSLPRLFTYHLNDKQQEDIRPGQRVIVEFGKSKLYTGVVRSIHNNKPENYSTKPIHGIIDDDPIVNNFQLQLWQWVTQYYMCTPGEVLKAALPAGLKLESETKIFLNSDFVANEHLNKGEESILGQLLDKGGMTLKELNASQPVKNVYPYIKSLIAKNAVSAEQVLDKGFKAKTETYVFLHENYYDEKNIETLFETLRRAKTQQNLVMVYLSQINEKKDRNEGIVKSELLQIAGAGHSALKALIEKQVFYEKEIEISRLNLEEEEGIAKKLNEVQKKALDQINEIFKTKNTILLHGITSSGKTEVYIQLIKKQLEEGKQVLYLLPEIALTTQIINRLRSVFGNMAGVYHSKFNDNERVEVYNGVAKKTGEEGAIQLVLGVRSSVFLPFHNLGLVIVDEEHENTYKQYDPAPRYHARDTAIYLAMLHGAKTLLGTATPSVESYYNAKTGKYGLVELKERYLNIQLPEIIVANTREAYRKKQMQSLFTQQMINELKLVLEKGEQAILFKNRRGYAPYLECNTCNWIPYCKNCDVTLTYHKNKNELTCHYCGFSRNVPVNCDVCGQPALQTKGYGTEKIEDELTVFFPEIRVMRMDLDSTRTKKAHEKIIDAFENKEVDILVGTQMISKGLDFDNVSLVGILNADSMLNFPDFRAHERSFQLMAQVSGRAGRKNKRGKVIIQASDDAHPVIQDVLHNNFKSLFIRQLDERKLFRYPPFYRLILLKVKHRDKTIVNRASHYLATLLFKTFGNRVTGPEFPLVERVQNLFQKNILLKVENEKAGTGAKSVVSKAIDILLSVGEYKNVRVTIDVDPL